MHILDLVQNSIKAEASLIEVRFKIDNDGKLEFEITDDGKGIAPEMLESIKNPFTTSRTTRRVGLGIPLLTTNAELSGGFVDIKSELGKGTKLHACFNTKNIDCLPIGDISGTFISLIISSPQYPDFIFSTESAKDKAELDTRELKNILAGVPLNEPGVLAWIDETINTELLPILGGI